jgi:hypothetical protein
MPLRPEMILEGALTALEKAQPVTNLMTGASNMQKLQQGQIQNQLLSQQAQQNKVMNPLLQQEGVLSNQLSQQTLDVNQQALNEAQKKQFIGQLGMAAKVLKPFVDQGDLLGAAGAVRSLQGIGLPPEVMQDIDGMIATGDMSTLQQHINAIEQFGATSNIPKIKATHYDEDAGWTGITDTGEVFVKPVATGQPTRMQRRLQEMQAQIATEQAKSGILVDQTKQVEQIKQREARVSEITEELSKRNRDWARTNTKLTEALSLAKDATQGIAGEAKTKLSSLLPGIDVTNEAALDSALQQLALEQLSSFVGQTTNYEFGVVQNITGKLGNSREANIARLNSLKRAAWFNQREYDQFKNHVKQGGEPDDFSFNFDEHVKLGEKTYTLKDIRDTAAANNLTIEDLFKRLDK